MSIRWVNFADVKKRVSIKDVIFRYGWLSKLEDKGSTLVGPCPIHKGTSATSFHVDLGKNVYHCFSKCKQNGNAGGNVLDFVMRMEECDIRSAALKLCDWFGLEYKRDGGSVQASGNGGSGTAESEPRSAAAGQESRSVDEINPPLARPLANLKEHPYLFERGLTAPTIQEFGVGWCSRGLMRNRIAIPIHNEGGKLVAYAGRALDTETEGIRKGGKYKLPKNFAKSRVLFNLNRVLEMGDRGLAVVVEGYFDAMVVHQSGFPCVALMGSELSEYQEQLLLAHFNRLALMLDGDEAGIACKREIWKRLVRKLYIRDIHLEDGEQPDTISEDRLREFLG